MKFTNPVEAKELAEIIGAKLSGENIQATGINEIHRVEKGDICFVDHPKYYNKVLESPADVIIINKEITPPENKALLIHPEPFIAFNELLEFFIKREFPLDKDDSYVSPKATVGKNVVIGKSVKIADNVVIGDNVSIGNYVEIGENTLIYPGTRIGDRVKIGENCLIQYNAVIGGEPFYYKNYGTHRVKMVRGGGVLLEDNVHIGSNTTIDAGVSADTIIGAHTKIDNLVQVGHDTIIGKHCLIASQVGIAGANVIEDNVTLWGQVGVPSGLRIGKGAVLLGKAGVMSDLDGGKVYAGYVAQERRKTWQEIAALRKLPEIIRKLKI